MFSRDPESTGRRTPNQLHRGDGVPERKLIHGLDNQQLAAGAILDGNISVLDVSAKAGSDRTGPMAADAWRISAPARDIGRKTGRHDPLGAHRRRAHRAWSSLRVAVILGDLLVLIAAPMLCYRLGLGDWLPGAAGRTFIQVSCLLTMGGLQLAGAYSRPAMQRPSIACRAMILGETVTIIGIMSFGFIGQGFNGLPRLWPIMTWAAGAVVIGAIHLGVTVLVARIMKAGYLRERVALVGTGALARMALDKFREAASPEVSVVGIFDDRMTRLPVEFEGYEVNGNTSSLLSYIRRHSIDRVILTIPWTAEKRIFELVTKLRQAPVRVDLIPHKLIWDFPSNIDRIHGVPIVTVANHRVDAQMDLLKRAEDLVLGALMLLAIAPVMITIAICIRLDSPGPILFRQKRFGFNNEIFEVYKFRSMYVDEAADRDARQATKRDPRITRIGRFIRKTSLDELPQLLQVLTGTMSLVGPRPHAVPHNDQYGKIVDCYFARHNVKPGITGWAQVNGHRGETDTVEKMNCRVRYDLEYIDRWSLLFDIKIVALTAIRIWFQETAY
jgi:Undecaprenyl-phosphate glucose phosphotransferase